MPIAHELRRLIDRMEGLLVQDAQAIIQRADFKRDEEDTARRQFKLAIEAAHEAHDMEVLKAFLAYQAARHKEAWGYPMPGQHQQLLVQVVWHQMQQRVHQYQWRAVHEHPGAWGNVNEEEKKVLGLELAARFFAHIERALEIWKDKEANKFYFARSSATVPVAGATAEQGDEQRGA